MKKLSIFNITLFIIGLWGNSVLFSQEFEIENLSSLKNRIIDNIYSGKLETAQKKVIDDAILLLDNLKMPKNPTFIFDVDETSLSNLEYELQYNFGYESKSWDEWLLKGKATAIKEVKRFYDTLLKRNIRVIFLTGRKHQFYKETYDNLRNEGYNQFDTLICKTDEYSNKTATFYKSDNRRKLSKDYDIIGSIGDQWSDLDGGWTVMKVKIPNYMYFLK